ncbi:hypothetical protein WJX74_007914 [Apatococcus lobatus]|uniref:JmjC domain-containing protein n=1 Tax=Apatococcus lobatus TaxID=904363 RepID=A0AAW1R106_9CHLO
MDAASLSPVPLSPDLTSQQLADLLKANSSSRGVQFYRLGRQLPQSTLRQLQRCTAACCNDDRDVFENSVASAPSAYPTTVQELWRNAACQKLSAADAEAVVKRVGVRAFYSADLVLAEVDAFQGTFFGKPVPRITKNDEGELDWEIEPEDVGRSFFPFAPTTIAATDEGLGSIGSLPEGLGAAVGIISGQCATTRLHAEDGYLASSNYLQYGAGKVWYVVSREYTREFIDSIPSEHRHCLVSKTWFPPQPTLEQLQTGKITRIVQQPGCLVITEPGCTLHWTLSCGRSVCESANFFLRMGGLNMQDCLAACIRDFRQWTIGAPESVRAFCDERVHAAEEIAAMMEFDDGE